MRAVKMSNGTGVKRLYASDRRGKTYYRYHRPDNHRQLGLGHHEQHAKEVAGTLNTIFGVDKAHSRMPRNFYHMNAAVYVSNNDVTHEIQVLIPEFFGAEEKAREKRNKNISSWAHDVDERKYKGNHYIRVSDISADSLPAWAVKIFNNTRKNARQRSIDFNLTHDDYVTMLKSCKGYCSVTGIRLRHDETSTPGARGKRPWAPSIDRIDSDKGYNGNNCRIVCVAANLAMSMWGEEVLIAMAKSLARAHLRELDGN